MELQELLTMVGKRIDEIVVRWMGLLHIFSDWNQCLQPFLDISVGKGCAE
jgi:hypothetical protein